MKKTPWSQLDDRKASLKKMWKAAEEVLNRATGKNPPPVKPAPKQAPPPTIDIYVVYFDRLSRTAYRTTRYAAPGFVVVELLNTYSYNGYAIDSFTVSTAWLATTCRTSA